MSLKFFFGSLIVLFLIVFISSQECDNQGQIIGDEYCSSTGLLEPLKQGGETCLNNYECAEGSCVESICQSKFPSFQERSDVLQNIWFFFSGEECDPQYDMDYHCIGQVAYLCGENYVWEEKGEIPGLCGVTTSSSGSKRIDIIIFSPKNITYNYAQIPLKVIDKNKKANYWRYSLNNGQKSEFTPNTTINAAIGFNKLEVYASKYSSFSPEEESAVSFSVNILTGTSFCGDGICDINEDSYTCTQDCGEPQVIIEHYCGDGVCDLDESSVTCPGDCPAKARKDFTWLFFVLLALVIALILIIGFLLIRRFGKKIMKMEKSTPGKPSILPQKMPPGKPIVNSRQPPSKTFSTKANECFWPNKSH